MWNGLLFFALLSSPSTQPAPHASFTFAPPSRPLQGDAEFEQRRKAAGNDVDKLWDVYKWCKEQKKDDKGRSVLRQIIRLDPNHEDANTALGYVKYDGKWFPSQKKVDEYKKEQEDKQAKADGLVDYKGQRVPPADVPFLEKGMVKDDIGNWVDAEDYKKAKEGWIKQDLEWVSPEEKGNIEKGLWKCGGTWLSLDDANKFHSDAAHWWRLPSEHFLLYTTCDRKLAIEKVKWNLDRAWEDLTRIYKIEPKQPVVVIVLRDENQYNEYAAGDQDAGVDGADRSGLSSVHYSYFSELDQDPINGQLMFPGIAYWDASTDVGNKWGVHAVRSALGLAYSDAIDPSTKTIEKVRKLKRVEKSFLDDYYAEKRLPPWFRTGAEAYAERYYIDIFVNKDGDNLWARKWSIENITNKGGLRPLKQLLDAKVTVEGGPDTPKLMNEMGLAMAFIVDGKCVPVVEKWKAVQDALVAGKDKKELTPLFQALAEEVIKHETDLRKFANI